MKYIYNFKEKIIVNLKIISLILCAFILASCASVQAPQQSKVIENYQQLTTQPDGSRAYIGKNIYSYNLIKIFPSKFHPDTSSKNPTVKENEVKSLLQDFDNALNHELISTRFSITQEVEPNSICIQPYITSIILTKNWLNVATSAMLLGPVSHGGATTAIDAYDCNTKQRVAAEVRDTRASVFSELSSSYSTTGHTQIEIKNAAKSFANLLISYK
ncbi:DUF3313 family protein [Serratia rubidaea]|nr:DUF3313 family protein [Serratia rubidaea]